MKRMGLFLSVVLMMFWVAGCGGGGDDGNSSPSPVTTQSIAGIWIGSFTSNVSHRTFSILGVITEQGMARFISTALHTEYTADRLNVSGNNFSATATVYGGAGRYDGTAELAGTFTQRGNINGTFAGVGDAGSFSLAYNSLYERPSSLEAIAGTWTNYASGYYEKFTIDSNGNVSRPVISGCTTSGSVSIIDPRYNVYAVNLTVNNCGDENGFYRGLAVMTDTEASNDTIVGSANTTTHSVIADLRRD